MFGSSMIQFVSSSNAINYSFADAAKRVFGNLIPAILDGICWFFYWIMRFILNIVDFMQFFVKKLVGLDYWGTSKVSIDTLGDSDVIFKFLFNPSVQRIFRLLLGVFAVLLIVFTIVAIVKNEYVFATGDTKNSTSIYNILKRSLKAIVLVIIMPVLLIMGILASNAILTSLVNAFNVNNSLTLGSQIFVASAYDANKFRLYAENGVRYAATEKVKVTINGESRFIDSSIPVVNPKNFTSKNKFTGYMFSLPEYSGKNFLYYVANQSDKEFYKKYITDVIGGRIKNPEGKHISVDSGNFISANLDDNDQSSEINIAAYNTWGYNKVLFEKEYTFAQTLDSRLYSTDGEQGFVSTSGSKYNALTYSNNATWSKYHDGGKNGLVALQDEYYVMADVIDFMLNEGTEMAIVNFANPLIDWDYTATGGYLNTNYIHSTNMNMPAQSIDSFVVNYKNIGLTAYKPNVAARQEQDGAIYIMAYYNSSTGRYIPMVHNKTYVDNFGRSHTFKSSYLDSRYEGLVVARGLLETTYENRSGEPTQITGEFIGANGDMVNVDTPKKYTLTASELSTYLTFDKKITGSFQNSNIYNELVAAGIDNIRVNSDGTLQSLNGNLNEKIQQIAQSLPTSFTYNYLNGNNNVVEGRYSDIKWRACVKEATGFGGIPLVVDGQTRGYLVFEAIDQSGNPIKIQAHVDNNDFIGNDDSITIKNDNYVSDISNASVKSVPLYCFVNIGFFDKGNSTSYNETDKNVNIMFAYAQYENADYDWFMKGLLETGKYGVSVKNGDGIYGFYSENIDGTSSQKENGLLARVLSYDANIDLDYSSPLLASDAEKTSELYMSKVTKLNTLSFPDSKIYSNQIDNSVFEKYGSNSVSTTINVSVDGGNKDIVNSFNVLTANVGKYYPFITGSDLSNTIAIDGSQYSNGTFSELANERKTEGNVTTYLFKYSLTPVGESYPVIAKVTFDSSTGVASLLMYSYFNINCQIGNNVEKLRDSSGNIISVSEYSISLLELSQSTTNSSIVKEYKYDDASLDFIYYVNMAYKYDKNTGIYSYLDAYLNNFEDTSVQWYSMLKVDVILYNDFVYKIGNTTYQYNPSTQKNDTLAPIAEYTYLLRTKYVDLQSVGDKDSDGRYTYSITLLGDNQDKPSQAGEENAIAYYNTTRLLDTSSIVAKLEALNNSNNLQLIKAQHQGNYEKIPVYESMDKFTEDKAFIHEVIVFKRDALTKGSVFFDFKVDLVNIFKGDVVWRFKLGLGVKQAEEKVSSVNFDHGRFSIDYNFNSLSKMSMNHFFSPGKMNILILVFASVLVLMVLGQAVWGLIGRIYNITLYFVIMPAITSTMPLEDNAKFSKWRSNLVKEVFGAYGVMLGLNFFFILIPAIRGASQLFTEADLQTSLAQGNWLAKINYQHLNNLVYLLFLLVAFTLIKSLPGTLAGLMDVKEVYKDGGDVKKNVESTVKDVGKHVSGKSIIDAKNNAKGMLKNFVPGSAIYDDWRSKHPKKEKEKKKDKVERQAKERGKQAATADMESTISEAEALRQQIEGGVTEAVAENEAAAQNVADAMASNPETTEAIAEQVAEQSQEANPNAEVVAENVENLTPGQIALDELNAQIAETTAQRDEIDKRIKDNLVEGYDFDDSINYYYAAADERAELQSKVDAEKAKRTEWINNAIKAGKLEAGSDKAYIAEDGKEHDELGVPYKSEWADSTQRLEQLNKQLNELPKDPDKIKDQLVEDSAAKEALENKLVDQQKLKEELEQKVAEELEAAKKAAEKAAEEAARKAVMDAAEETKQAAAQAKETLAQTQAAKMQAQESENKSKVYSDISKLYSEAGKKRDDINAGNYDPIYEEKKSRKEKKLEKLEEKSQERLSDQAEGNAHTYLKTLGARKRAYKMYNENADADSEILGRKEMKEKFSDMSRKEKKTFKRDQYIKRAEARNSYINTKLDNKILAQQEKVAKQQNKKHYKAFKHEFREEVKGTKLDAKQYKKDKKLENLVGSTGSGSSSSKFGKAIKKAQVSHAKRGVKRVNKKQRDFYDKRISETSAEMNRLKRYGKLDKETEKKLVAKMADFKQKRAAAVTEIGKVSKPKRTTKGQAAKMYLAGLTEKRKEEIKVRQGMQADIAATATMATAKQFNKLQKMYSKQNIIGSNKSIEDMWKAFEASRSYIKGSNITVQNAKVEKVDKLTENKIKNEFKKSFNELIKNDKNGEIKKAFKSAGQAFLSSGEYQRNLEDRMKKLEDKLRTKKLSDAESKMLNKLRAQNEKLKSIQNKLAKDAKKLGKDVKTLMKDKRSKRYAVPKIKDSTNSDPDGK